MESPRRNKWNSPGTVGLESTQCISTMKSEEELRMDTIEENDAVYVSDDDDDASVTSSSNVKRSRILVNRLPGETLGLEIDIKRSAGVEDCIIGVFISKVTSGGPAQRSANSVGKPLHRGDEIVSVNDRVLRLCTHAEVVSVFKQMPLTLRLGISRVSRASTPSYSNRSTPANITFEEMLARRKISAYSVADNDDDDDDLEDDGFEWENDPTTPLETPISFSTEDLQMKPKNNFQNQQDDLEDNCEGQGNFAFQTCKSSFLLEGFESRRIILRKKYEDNLGLKLEPIFINDNAYYKIAEIRENSIFKKRPLLFVDDILVLFNNQSLKNIDSKNCQSIISTPTDTLSIELLRAKQDSAITHNQLSPKINDNYRSEGHNVITTVFQDIFPVDSVNATSLENEVDSVKKLPEPKSEVKIQKEKFDVEAEVDNAFDKDKIINLAETNDKDEEKEIVTWYQQGIQSKFHRRADLKNYRHEEKENNTGNKINEMGIIKESLYANTSQNNSQDLMELSDSKNQNNLIDFDSLEDDFASISSKSQKNSEKDNYFKNDNDFTDTKNIEYKKTFTTQTTQQLKKQKIVNTGSLTNSTPTPALRKSKEVTESYDPYTHMSIASSKIGHAETKDPARIATPDIVFNDEDVNYFHTTNAVNEKDTSSFMNKSTDYFNEKEVIPLDKEQRSSNRSETSQSGDLLSTEGNDSVNNIEDSSLSLFEPQDTELDFNNLDNSPVLREGDQSKFLASNRYFSLNNKVQINNEESNKMITLKKVPNADRNTFNNSLIENKLKMQFFDNKISQSSNNNFDIIDTFDEVNDFKDLNNPNQLDNNYKELAPKAAINKLPVSKPSQPYESKKLNDFYITVPKNEHYTSSAEELFSLKANPVISSKRTRISPHESRLDYSFENSPVSSRSSPSLYNRNLSPNWTHKTKPYSGSMSPTFPHKNVSPSLRNEEIIYSESISPTSPRKIIAPRNPLKVVRKESMPDEMNLESKNMLRHVDYTSADKEKCDIEEQIWPPPTLKASKTLPNFSGISELVSITQDPFPSLPDNSNIVRNIQQKLPNSFEISNEINIEKDHFPNLSENPNKVAKVSQKLPTSPEKSSYPLNITNNYVNNMHDDLNRMTKISKDSLHSEKFDRFLQNHNTRSNHHDNQIIVTETSKIQANAPEIPDSAIPQPNTLSNSHNNINRIAKTSKEMISLPPSKPTIANKEVQQNKEGMVVLAKNLLALLTSDCNYPDSSIEEVKRPPAHSNSDSCLEIVFPAVTPIDMGLGPIVEIFGVNTTHCSVIYTFKDSVEQLEDVDAMFEQRK